MIPRNFRNISGDEWRAFGALAVVIFALGGFYHYLAMRTDLLHPVKPYIFVYIFAFLFYFYASVRVVPALSACAKFTVPLIIVSAIVFRLMLVHTPPSLSTDIYRYVWDGRLSLHHINPYRWAPNDPRLTGLRDHAIWGRMEYKYYQTIYMPISQLFFAIGYLLFGSNLTGFKLMYVCFDIGVMLMVLRILRQRGFPLGNIVWYAWCPLPITEVALAGHQDPAGVFFLVCALYLVLRSRPIKAGALIVAAGFTKGFAFLLLPLFIRRFGVRFSAWVVAALAIMGLPLWFCFPEFLHGTQQYLSTVHANSGLFYLINRLLIPVLPRSAFTMTAHISDVVVLAVLAWSVWTRPHSQAELIRRSVVVICACLLVTPTLFPWYVLWMLPLAVVQKERPSYAVIALTGSVGMMYLFYIDDTIFTWIRVVEYLPFFLLLAIEIKNGYWGELVFGRREDGDSPAEMGPEPFSPERDGGSDDLAASSPGAVPELAEVAPVGLDAEGGETGGDAGGPWVTGPAAAKY